MKTSLGLLAIAATLYVAPSLAQQPTAGAKPASPAGQDEVGRYMAALSDARRKFFAEAMNGLSAAQLKTFWEVFADFEKEKNALAATRVDAVASFAQSFGSASGLTDADVNTAVGQMTDLQKKLIDLRMKYFDIYSKKIDVKTAGRFALCDDYVATAVRLDWLTAIPFPGDEIKR